MDQVNNAGRKVYTRTQNKIYFTQISPKQNIKCLSTILSTNLYPIRFSLQLAKNKIRESVILVLQTDQTEAKKWFQKCIISTPFKKQSYESLQQPSVSFQLKLQHWDPPGERSWDCSGRSDTGIKTKDKVARKYQVS